MACPFFVPASTLAGFSDLQGGECAAQPEALIPTDTLRRCCNRGYARGTCRHAAESNADAFRFLIKSNRDGVVAVAWSSERDHHPVAVGTLLITQTSGGEDPLARQARSFAATYLRQNAACS